MKDASGTSWKEELFEGKLLEGTVNPGDPSILVISTSAIRSLELLRIKKLIDMDALGLSRLSVIVMDMHTDAKGYLLLTLPQVSDEFWDLYKSYFHHLMVQGDLCICLYSRTSCASDKMGAVTHDE
ncbi:hypothetical protein IFM89_020094 [Coptis chinensis]|uniref:Uncharacterized protein n=1 Tax=Coptis chinensis TaxID=261450 RepID=A0A835HEE8_9MAGN|nr:hypothetical protein IFM89_020094 [Coptis chinensis]